MPSQAAIDRQTTALTLIEGTLRDDTPALVALLPVHVPVARIIDVVLTAARKTPGLLDCSPESFVYAIREAARYGLVPDGVMGQGYLIPRFNSQTGVTEATFMAGYRGLEDLARRTGVVASIVSGWHTENDPVFNISLGLHGDVEHVPAPGPRGAIVGFYAAAWLTNGAPPVVAYMPDDEVIAIRNAIPKWDKGPWRTHYAQMGRKTAVRRLIGQLPLSADIQSLIGAEDEAWSRAIDVTPSEPAEGTAPVSEAARILAGRRGPSPEVREASAPESPAPAAPSDDEAQTGTVRLIDRPGLDGKPQDTPQGTIVGFRLDTGEGDDEWAQVVMTEDVATDVTLRDGGIITVTGRRVLVSRKTPEGLAMPPLVRIIASEVGSGESSDPAD